MSGSIVNWNDPFLIYKLSLYRSILPLLPFCRPWSHSLMTRSFLLPRVCVVRYWGLLPYSWQWEKGAKVGKGVTTRMATTIMGTMGTPARVDMAAVHGNRIMDLGTTKAIVVVVVALVAALAVALALMAATPWESCQ